MVLYQIDTHLKIEILSPSDAKNIYSLIESNREHLHFLEWEENTKSAQDIADFIETSLEQFKKMSGLNYKIIYNNELVGVVGFVQKKEKTKVFEIGCWLNASHTNQGIGTKTVAQMETICFEYFQASKTELHCAVENLASNRVASKLNYTLEGTIRNAAKIKGIFLTYNIYGKLNPKMENMHDC